MEEGDASAGEKFGYKAPPAKNRFKKGRSGNPQGRPKGIINLEKMVDEALLSQAVAGGRKTRLIDMIVIQVLKKAAKGNRWAIDFLLENLPEDMAPKEILIYLPGADECSKF